LKRKGASAPEVTLPSFMYLRDTTPGFRFERFDGAPCLVKLSPGKLSGRRRLHGARSHQDGFRNRLLRLHLRLLRAGQPSRRRYRQGLLPPLCQRAPRIERGRRHPAARSRQDLSQLLRLRSPHARAFSRRPSRPPPVVSSKSSKRSKVRGHPLGDALSLSRISG